MNKYMKYGIELIVFMIIFAFVDTRNHEPINWLMNIIFSCIIILAQYMIDKRKNKYQK